MDAQADAVAPRRAGGWVLVAAGAVVAAAGGVATIALVAGNALDSPTTAGWVAAWLALLGGVGVGALVAGAGFRRLSVRGWRRAVPLGLLVSLPATLTPWVLAVVVA
jgi:hypothetical protein